MFISHAEAQLFTVKFGNASRALVALGGWAGSWELWLAPFGELSQTWRTIAYDHRGVGSTIAPTHSITVQTMVDDVFAVMDALKVDRCVLAAESAGAVIALQAALQQPQRFTGLVLVDGLYYRPKLSEPDAFVAGLKSDFHATIRQFVDQCLTEHDGEEIYHWGRQILERSSQAAAIQLYECVDGVDLRPQLSQINMPTLIIHGETDQIVPVASARWLADQLPQSHLHIVKGSGHVPTITHAREVADAINRYFGEVD